MQEDFVRSGIPGVHELAMPPPTRPSIGLSGPACLPSMRETGPVCTRSQEGSRTLLAAEPLVQPGPGESPQAVGGPAADPEDLGRLLVRQPREEAHLDQASDLLVVLLQLGQGLVEGDQLV